MLFKMLNTKTGRQREFTEQSLKQELYYELSYAEEKFYSFEEWFLDKYGCVLSHEEPYDDEIPCVHDTEVTAQFFADFKNNWNSYSEDWPSPTGVIPIWKCLEVINQ